MDVTSSINGFIRTNVISSMALRCHLVPSLTTSKLIMAASLPLPRAWLRRGRTATNISSHWLVTLYRSSIPFVDVNLCFARKKIVLLIVLRQSKYEKKVCRYFETKGNEKIFEVENFCRVIFH